MSRWLRTALNLDKGSSYEDYEKAVIEEEGTDVDEKSVTKDIHPLILSQLKDKYVALIDSTDKILTDKYQDKVGIFKINLDGSMSIGNLFTIDSNVDDVRVFGNSIKIYLPDVTYTFHVIPSENIYIDKETGQPIEIVD